MNGSHRILLFSALVTGGCGQPAPVDATLGGFLVHVEPGAGSFLISRLDGTPLVDAFAASRSEPNKPPRGVAFRTPMTTIDQQYGSYLFTEETMPWQIAQSFESVTVTADTVSFTLAGIEGGAGSIHLDGEARLGLAFSNAKDSRVSIALRAVDGEHYLGLGAHSQDLDLRGGTVANWTSEQGIGQSDNDEPPAAWFLQGSRHQSYFPVPFVLSSRGYGLEIEKTQRAIFTLASEASDLMRLETWDKSTAITLYDGPTLPEVLERRTALTGRPPVPPDWTFAPWNDAIYGEANVSRVAGVLRTNKIPSSAIWTEDWAGGKQDGVTYSLPYEWRVDRGLYPNVEKLASDLHAAGFRFLAYFNTFVESDVSHYAEVRDAGYLIKKVDGTPYTFQSARFTPASLVDLSNAAARTYLAGKMSATLALGFDGWMADYAEWLPTDCVLASGEASLDVHNRYPVDWQKLNDQVFTTSAGDAQSFVRSGGAGSSRIKRQVVWGGDQLASFRADDGLPTVIPLALGLGISGLPYFGSDIGGYTNIDGSAPRGKELFFRWTMLGAFSVVMRTHHGLWPQMNWDFEKDAETTTHYGHWARVHTRLFPYLKAQAAHSVDTGMPIMRALALGFPAEDTAYTDKSEFMLGPSLLVAPVVDEGATSRSVFLPVARWLKLSFSDDGEPQAAPAVGGGANDVPAGVTEIPVYLRAGTLVTMLPSGIETLSTVADAAGMKGLAQIGTLRTLLVGLGASPDAEGAVTTDDLGGHYALTSAGAPAAAPSFTFGGVALVDCAGGAASCVSLSNAGTAQVKLTGNGALEVKDATGTVARLELSARAADAQTNVKLYW